MISKRLVSELGVVRPLRSRVTPIEGESLMSIVARACEANVFERLVDVLGFAGFRGPVAAFMPFTGVDLSENLAALLSANINDVRARLHPAVDCVSHNPRIDWFGASLERRFIEARVRRVSPAALRSSPHHRAIWMVRPLSFCPETHEFLISACPRCERALGWTHTKGVAVCEHCNASLLDHEPGHLSPEHIADARIAASLVAGSANERRAALRHFPKIFAEWSSTDVFDAAFNASAAWRYARSETSKAEASRLSRGVAASYGVDQLVRGIQTLRGWPETLVPLVKELWSVSPAKDSSTLWRWVGPLGRFFVHGSARTPFQQLLTQDLPAAVWEAQIPVKRSALKGAAQQLRASDLSEEEAVAEFGVAQKTLRRLDREGRALVSHRRSVTKRYDRESLTASIGALKGSIPGHKCAIEIGVPAYTVAAIASAGLLDLVADHDALLMAGGGPLVTAPSFFYLTEGLLKDGVESKSFATLAEGMIGVLAPAAWERALSAIVERKMRAACPATLRGRVADRICIDPAELAQLLAEIDLEDYPGDAEISTMSAARVMGMSDVIVGKAIQQGLIDAVCGRRRHRIKLKDLAKFFGTMVSTGELARRLGCGAAAARSQLLAADLKPRATIHNTAQWDRSAAERVLGLGALPSLSWTSELAC